MEDYELEVLCPVQSDSVEQPAANFVTCHSILRVNSNFLEARFCDKLTLWFRHFLMALVPGRLTHPTQEVKSFHIGRFRINQLNEKLFRFLGQHTLP